MKQSGTMGAVDQQERTSSSYWLDVAGMREKNVLDLLKRIKSVIDGFFPAHFAANFFPGIVEQSQGQIFPVNSEYGEVFLLNYFFYSTRFFFPAGFPGNTVQTA